MAAEPSQRPRGRAQSKDPDRPAWAHSSWVNIKAAWYATDLGFHGAALGSSPYAVNSDVPGACHPAYLADSFHRDMNCFATARILNAATYAAQGAAMGCMEATSIQFSIQLTQLLLDFGDLGFMLRHCGEITTERCCCTVVPCLREIAT